MLKPENLEEKDAALHKDHPEFPRDKAGICGVLWRMLRGSRAGRSMKPPTDTLKHLIPEGSAPLQGLGRGDRT